MSRTLITRPSGLRFHDNDPAIGQGGEGVIVRVPSTQFVAKLFKHPDQQRRAKVEIMLGCAKRPTSAAWPQEIVVDKATGKFAGYTMPFVDSSLSLFEVYTPTSRLKVAPGFHYRYLVRTALNLSRLVAEAHQAGCVIGDLNESNCGINSQASVFGWDCDSWQILNPQSGQWFRCGVAKPDFLAPELFGARLDTVDRTVESDHWALAVLIFKLLSEGTHPFDAVVCSGADPNVAGRMALGLFPHASTPSPGIRPPPTAPAFKNLALPLQDAFRRGFQEGARAPSVRPTAREWVCLLRAAETKLVTCSHNANHLFWGEPASCPWCLRATALNLDPFPASLARKEKSFTASERTGVYKEVPSAPPASASIPKPTIVGNWVPAADSAPIARKLAQLPSSFSFSDVASLESIAQALGHGALFRNVIQATQIMETHQKFQQFESLTEQLLRFL